MFYSPYGEASRISSLKSQMGSIGNNSHEMVVVCFIMRSTTLLRITLLTGVYERFWLGVKP